MYFWRSSNPSVHQTPPLMSGRSPGLAFQRVNPLTLCRLWGPAWWIWGSEGPRAEGPAWLGTEGLGTEGPRRLAQDMTGRLPRGRKSSCEIVGQSDGAPFSREGARQVMGDTFQPH